MIALETETVEREGVTYRIALHQDTDDATLESARHLGGRTRRHFLHKRAREACAVYTQWRDGDVYGYEVARVHGCLCCGEERVEVVDARWGFYDLDACRGEARRVIAERDPWQSAGTVIGCNPKGDSVL